MVTTSIKINLAIFFKGVDVVENKEWLRGEDAYTVSLFSVDDVESRWFILIPTEPICRACCEDSVSKNFPDIYFEGVLGNNNKSFCQAELFYQWA